MSKIPENLKYATSHEWARLDADGYVTVGITDHAQALLGDIVFVELPDPDADVGKGDEVCVIESVKAASDIYTPISGKIVTINQMLSNAPEHVNNHPYGDGWIFRMQPSDVSELDELLTAAGYAQQIESEAH